ncbi:MAG TPA: hypothetical protein VNW04_05775 [Puia sp.]|jgi:hypothetical protein|nr:hypothetical protein [Puia sp.]
MAKSTSNNSVYVWEQDPGSGAQPDGGPLLQVPVPQPDAGSLPTRIENPAVVPPPQLYPQGSPEFRYWAAVAALVRGSTFWSSRLPGVSWEVGPVLPVDLDHGEDLNAFYDRVGLRFFHGQVGGRVFYSGESPDVINHEQGHAVLDSFKPQLWDAASLEIAAFHESFGDMSALLCALQMPSLRSGVLSETGGTVYKSSRLSRLAEQLGFAIRQSFPTDVDPDCLRNAVNSFFYRDPHTIPTMGPANVLSSEPHSFSRVFTAAFFESLAGMFRVRPAQDEDNLLQAAIDIATILVGAIQEASVVPNFYSEVAVHMINIANTNFAALKYGAALSSGFVAHGVLSPAASIVAPGRAAFKMVGAKRPTSLAPIRLSVGEYNLGTDNILAFAASDAKQFDVAGASLNIGAVEPVSQDQAAKAFFEDLLRRGKVKILSADGKQRMGLARATAPTTHESHTHELRLENNEFVLRRVRIDCGWQCCDHQG